MGENRPIKTKCWVAFLEYLGCKEEKKKSGGSHFKWKCPECRRSIIIRPKDKEIPAFHIFTNLKT
ncbi:hypothetical protein FNH22_21925 [Fulvivirga sp. M361]|nr:hypothetical protein FNH22_21925 [Fulvivirga sp. M361]